MIYWSSRSRVIKNGPRIVRCSRGNTTTVKWLAKTKFSNLSSASWTSWPPWTRIVWGMSPNFISLTLRMSSKNTSGLNPSAAPRPSILPKSNYTLAPEIQRIVIVWHHLNIYSNKHLISRKIMLDKYLRSCCVRAYNQSRNSQPKALSPAAASRNPPPNKTCLKQILIPMIWRKMWRYSRLMMELKSTNASTNPTPTTTKFPFQEKKRIKVTSNSSNLHF